MPAYLWRREETPLQRLALAPLLLAEGPYRLGVWLHRRLYEVGLLERKRLPARVVVVGNLAVGGSAKTPVVAWLAAELLGRGRKVAVLCRGVRGRRMREVNVVSNGERVLLDPAAVGDEAVWIAGAAPGVPVLAGRDRAALGLRALALFGSEVLLLDDGFQHHRLARDIDLVCIDGGLGLGNRHVLPRGPLREPARRLAAADALVITRAAATRPEDVDSLPLGPPRFRVEIQPRRIRDLATGEGSSTESLKGRRVGLLAAIARPDRLRQDLARLGAEVVAERVFPDHHRYAPQEIAQLDGGFPWVMTGKDAVKIPPDWASGRRLWVLEEEVRREGALELLEWLGARLNRPARIA
jgi:tetraacyldisaccharide 4'-kinase